MTEDKVRVWHIRMPDLQQATEQMPDIVVPELHWLPGDSGCAVSAHPGGKGTRCAFCLWEVLNEWPLEGKNIHMAISNNLRNVVFRVFWPTIFYSIYLRWRGICVGHWKYNGVHTEWLSEESECGFACTCAYKQRACVAASGKRSVKITSTSRSHACFCLQIVPVFALLTSLIIHVNIYIYVYIYTYAPRTFPCIHIIT